MVFLGYATIFLYILMLLGLVTLLGIKCNVPEYTTRKIVHIFSSFTWIAMYFFLGTSIHLIIAALCFIVVNTVNYKTNIIKALYSKYPNNIGTVYYSISLLIMATITYFVPAFFPYYGIGFFCMGIADGLSPFVIKLFKGKGKIRNSYKTIPGSVSVFVLCFIIILIFASVFNLNLNIIKAVVISVAGMVLELLGVNGLDNFFLPLGTSGLAFALAFI